jgi:hypothetical protein
MEEIFDEPLPFLDVSALIHDPMHTDDHELTIELLNLIKRKGT